LQFAARLLFRFARSRLASNIVGWGFAHMAWLLPVSKLHETASVVAFRHPKPSHKVHILIVPKSPIRSFLDIDEEGTLMQEIVRVAQHLVQQLGLDETGYRLLVNGGSYQEVPQLHFHLVSDEEPPHR